MQRAVHFALRALAAVAVAVAVGRSKRSAPLTTPANYSVVADDSVDGVFNHTLLMTPR